MKLCPLDGERKGKVRSTVEKDSKKTAPITQNFDETFNAQMKREIGNLLKIIFLFCCCTGTVKFMWAGDGLAKSKGRHQKYCLKKWWRMHFYSRSSDLFKNICLRALHPDGIALD